jgi:hypothetical protein
MLPNRKMKDKINNRPMKHCRRERNRTVTLPVEKPAVINVRGGTSPANEKNNETV